MKRLIFCFLSCFTLLCLAKTPDEVCQEAIEKKTDITFNNCLNVLEFASSSYQYAIADMYTLGLYPPFKRDKNGLIEEIHSTNNMERLKWIIKSANNIKPYASSAYLLAEMYKYGRSDLHIARDYLKSIHYFKIASKLGSPKASGWLADFYISGKGVKKDLYLGYIFDNIALAQTYQDQEYEFILRDELDNIEKTLDSETINKAQKVSRECVESKFTKCNIY